MKNSLRKNRFLTLIALFLIVVFISGYLFSRDSSNKETQNTQIKTKQVEIFELADDNNYLYLTAEIENSQKIDIRAQANGVVFKIYKSEGEEIKKGEKIINLSSNYVGANAASVQAAIAYKQYKQAKESKDQQLELINRQREIANLTSENSEEQRNIAEASLNDTNQLVEVSEQMLQETQDALNSVTDPDIIAELEAAIVQQQASLAQLKAQQRNLSYQANSEEPPTKLAQTGKEISLLQLDLQQNALDHQIELARLQSAAASIQASAFFPQSPVYGIIEKIYVSENEVVNPGQIIATFRSHKSNSKLVAYVPTQFYIYLNSLQSSEIILGNDSYFIEPSYVSTIAVKTGLHAITYEVDGILAEKLAGENYVKVKLAVEKKNGDGQLIPLDALYTSQNNSTVYVVRNEKAEAVEVGIGQIIGSFVEVEGDFNDHEQIIISRNVVAGDNVTHGKARVSLSE